ncbi:hypothetical protein BAE44_0012258 [Dichanthelium oligosanthes]|uniref:Myb/SANT-like DNA-binding domain-containing protein n=1 Tax=Dichanthelium oligosanthes TaxID=888268 RepID=A0A1E5VNL4_9POAL|nr:hypothetical protein BAE44_0012258 [Dichanthelium oligosanthes]
MEGNLTPRALIPGGAPFDLGQPFHFAAQPQVVQVHQGAFASPAANQMEGLGSVVKASLSSEEDADDGHHGHGKAAASASQWHRVKWTSNMVKLLVSAVSYIDDDIDADHGTSSGRRKHAMLKRKGKWRLVSSAMTERGFFVSPQQCEDKFNDLNKRYKRLTEILGRGRACQIVEKPALLEQVSLSGKLKEEAKKHLSSKHLHYEEMCSYHNHNRQCLLDDPVLQTSEKNPSGMTAIQIERERLKIKGEMLKLEQNHLKWLRSSKEQDRELQKMKLENERMELKNEQLELKLRLKEIEMGIKPKRI